MRISEKTIELNVCAQVVRASKKSLIWFGLTQAQEAKAGFDAAFKLGGQLMIFQFKASDYLLSKSGARRFNMSHRQLEHLIRQSSSYRRSVFYAFPLIGNTEELRVEHGDFLNNTYLLDVSHLPTPYPKPTIKTSSTILRKSNSHHADVLLFPTPQVTIHSEARNFPLIQLASFVEGGFRGSDGLGLINPRTENTDFFSFYQQLLQLPLDLRRGMKGLIVL